MIKSMTRSTVTNRVDYRSMLAGNDAYSPGAFELISTVYGNDSTGTITFSSIPSTYKHLQIRFTSRNMASVTENDIRIQFNGVTTASYAGHDMYGDGSSVYSFASTSQTNIYAWIPMPGNNAAASIFNAGIIDILDYASTAKNKTLRHLTGMSANARYISLGSGFLNSTNAISSITLYTANSGAYSSSSRFSLYGIKG